MASTRNINTQSNYCLQNRANNIAFGYNLYIYKGVPIETRYPCFGINVGHVPAAQLSKNPTNTESFLYGIGATNLIVPESQFVAEGICIPGINFFNRPKAFLPPPLVVPGCQRPLGPFS